jgi:hypothetical protein
VSLSLARLERAQRAALLALVSGNTEHPAVKAYNAALADDTNSPEKGEATSASPKPPKE